MVEPAPAIARSAAWRQAGAIAALWLFCSFWNADKAFHIDDTAHLEIARWIAQNPLRPMQGLLFWEAVPEPIFRTNQPHLYFYLMAGWAALFGWSEGAMHALQSLFTLLALVLMHRLSLRFVPQAPWMPTALLALCPIFLAGQNTMVDIPLLALWLGFFGALCVPVASGAAPRYWMAAAWCSLALLVKYTSLVLMPVLLVFMLVRREGARAWVLLLPLATLALWSLFNLLDYGDVHLLRREPGDRQARGSWYAWLLLQTKAWLVVLGAMVPAALGLGLVWLRRGHRRVPLRLQLGIGLGLVLMPALAAVPMSGDTDATTLRRAAQVLHLANSAVLLALVAGVLLRQRPLFPGVPAIAPDLRALLLAWIVMPTVFVIVLAPFMAARHVLLVLPPLLLLAASALPRPVPGRWQATIVAVAALVGGAVAAADHRYAALYRTQAHEIRAALPREATVWFAGHWGWQWYATRAGMRALDLFSATPAPGDFIVYPAGVSKQPLDGLETLHTSVWAQRAVEPLAWLDHLIAPHAGLHHSTSWRLPWGISTQAVEMFHVLRVDAPPAGGPRP